MPPWRPRRPVPRRSAPRPGHGCACREARGVRQRYGPAGSRAAVERKGQHEAFGAISRAAPVVMKIEITRISPSIVTRSFVKPLPSWTTSMLKPSNEQRLDVGHVDQERLACGEHPHRVIERGRRPDSNTRRAPPCSARSKHGLFCGDVAQQVAARVAPVLPSAAWVPTLLCNPCGPSRVASTRRIRATRRLGAIRRPPLQTCPRHLSLGSCENVAICVNSVYVQLCTNHPCASLFTRVQICTIRSRSCYLRQGNLV